MGSVKNKKELHSFTARFEGEENFYGVYLGHYPKPQAGKALAKYLKALNIPSESAAAKKTYFVEIKNTSLGHPNRGKIFTFQVKMEPYTKEEMEKTLAEGGIERKRYAVARRIASPYKLGDPKPPRRTVSFRSKAKGFRGRAS